MRVAGCESAREEDYVGTRYSEGPPSVPPGPAAFPAAILAHCKIRAGNGVVPPGQHHRRGTSAELAPVEATAPVRNGESVDTE